MQVIYVAITRSAITSFILPFPLLSFFKLKRDYVIILYPLGQRYVLLYLFSYLLSFPFLFLLIFLTASFLYRLLTKNILQAFVEVERKNIPHKPQRYGNSVPWSVNLANTLPNGRIIIKVGISTRHEFPYN